MTSLIVPIKTAQQLAGLIDAYFYYIQGEFHLETKQTKVKDVIEDTEHKVWDREPEPPTFSGMALYIGFNSLYEFEAYEEKGEFAPTLKRGRLMVEAMYETKLHQSPAGAMFALKKMGWKEKPDERPAVNENDNVLKVQITNTGPIPAQSEKEVKL